MYVGMWRDRGDRRVLRVGDELEKEGRCEMERGKKRWEVKGDRWGNRGEKRRDERRTNKKVRMGIGIRGLEGL